VSLPVPLPLLVVGLLACVAVAGGLTYWYLNRPAPDSDADDSDATAEPALDVEEVLASGREYGSRIGAALTSTGAQLTYLAVGAVVVALAFVWAAWTFYGLWSTIAVVIGLVGGVSAPYIYVRVLFTPLGRDPLGAAFFILAQLTFGAGALVRRQDGGYEWGRLREDNAGLYTRLENGREVRIKGTRDDLPTVAWAPRAVVEEKTDANMARVTVDETFATSRTDPKADGAMIETPLALADGGEGWHLDASKLERWARGTANSELPRNGRRKALEEEGGQQRISQLVTMIGAAVLLVVGFGMSAGVLLLT